MTHPRYLLRSGPGDAAFNMALDEALLHAAPRLGQPVLRFYSWTEPAASFGYFQKYADVERLTPLRPLVRRPTGGGLVPHDADWTYSLAFPPTHEWYGLSAIDSYRRVHEWIRAAFAALGVATELAPACSGRDAFHRVPVPGKYQGRGGTRPYQTQGGQCFQGHERYDLLWRGHKLAGAAQRRTRDGLLIQGSIQPRQLSLARTDWEKAMCDAARLEQGAQWAEFAPESPLLDRALGLVRQKYSRPAYNQKR